MASAAFTDESAKLKIHEIANELLSLATSQTGEQEMPGMFGAMRSAMDLYAFRRKRDDLFDGSLFSEPSWDILLDLYGMNAVARPVSVTSACIAAAVPPTTGLRWLGILEERGLVERYDDPNDGRRKYLRLTSEARSKLDILFAA